MPNNKSLAPKRLKRSTQPAPGPTTIQGEFDRLDRQRTQILERAREVASLTIPGLFPEVGFTQDQELPVPYSSVGARCFTSMAAKVVTAVDPPNEIPFFSFDASPLRESPEAQQDPGLVVLMEQQLAQFERMIYERINASNFRAALHTAVLQMLCSGNALFQESDDVNFQVFRLDHYVVQRRPDGKVAKIILRHWVNPDLLPPELKNVQGTSSPSSGTGSNLGLEPLLCEITEREGKFYVRKEFRGQIVEGGEDAPKFYEISPYWALRWSEISGEDYGRSKGEENIGDLRTMESLSKSLIEGAAAMAEYRIGVDPTGITQVADLEDSENGAYVPAKKDDVFPIQAELHAQVEMTRAAKADLERSLNRTFLVDSAAQLTGERVTAYQVRLLAQELENALAGVFSSIARDIQLPVVLRTIELMRRDGSLPERFNELIQRKLILIRVRTGMEALGREITAAKLAAESDFLKGLPEVAQEVVKWDNFIRARWTAAGLDSTGILKTPEEQAQETQARIQQEAQLMATQQAVKTAGKLAEQTAA